MLWHPNAVHQFIFALLSRELLLNCSDKFGVYNIQLGQLFAVILKKSALNKLPASGPNLGLALQHRLHDLPDVVGEVGGDPRKLTTTNTPVQLLHVLCDERRFQG